MNEVGNLRGHHGLPWPSHAFQNASIHEAGTTWAGMDYLCHQYASVHEASTDKGQTGLPLATQDLPLANDDPQYALMHEGVKHGTAWAVFAL